jgi:hypothetical protein
MRQSICYIACLVALAGAASGQQPSPPTLDHFKCYFIPEQQVLPQEALSLEDQFDIPNFERVRDIRPVRLCNPVAKVHRNTVTPISNPKAHLILFQIDPQPIVPRDVLVRNQFGRQTLAVRDAKVLAVPTAKTLGSELPPTEIPSGLDHFKCYSAAGKRIKDGVTLRDQFHTETVRVLDPIAFCNPTRKIHGTVSTGVQNAAAHLTCYTITVSPFGGASVNVLNQFGNAQIRVLRADVLCVPSQKLKWSASNPDAEKDDDDRDDQ